jgi:hypothetical protein
MIDDTESKTVNGQTWVSFDSSLFLLDIFMGAQANALLGRRVKLYCGAGPLLMIGYVAADFEQREIEEELDIEISESDTAVGFGGYVRLGAEFMIGDKSALGLGVRGFTAALDFDDTLGSVDFKGVQGFFTYTAKW